MPEILICKMAGYIYETITVSLEFPQTSAAASTKRKRGAALSRKGRTSKKT